MNILVVHNGYQQSGGEDSVVEAEMELLRQYGHSVELYTRSNWDVGQIGRGALVRDLFWSRRTVVDIERLAERSRPDIIHVHNTFPLISPSVYWVANRLQLPVVQTLHNFRLLCLNGLFLRNGRICEDCKGCLPWRGVLRACYRDSHSASLAFGSSLALHNSLDTYQKNISRFIAPSSFACSKFVEGGINPSKLIVKPNFVRRAVSHPDVERRGLLFVGRLSTEKGVSMLGEVATRLGSGVSIRVVGDGPEAEILKPYASVSLLGRLPSESVRLEMSAAMALVVPSLCYETFGMVVVEAFSRGLPVIASRIGALAELVRDGETGLLFSPGDCDELAKKISWALANPAQMRRMGAAAQQEYERQYTPEVNHDLLISVYKSALSQSA